MSGAAAARILVIKHGALGDFIQALGPCAAIRSHHPGAHITLLTTAPFAGLAAASGCFDAVWLDRRLPWWRLDQLWRLVRGFAAGRFDRVYDLQTSARSSAYFRLFPPWRPPEWSGIARGASHRHDDPARTRLHTRDRQAAQLRLAGIATVPPPDLGFLDADIGRFGLPMPFALLVPGGSAHRPAKRWPPDRYSALAARLAAAGVHPVLLGGPEERGLLAAVLQHAPSGTSLAGVTTFADLAALARRAALAVGNDTGPMHLIAAAGCRSLVLFSGASDPRLCAPRGPQTTVLQRVPLSTLDVEEVVTALNEVGYCLGRAKD